jgi:hypothetical protein
MSFNIHYSVGYVYSFLVFVSTRFGLRSFLSDLRSYFLFMDVG